MAADRAAAAVPEAGGRDYIPAGRTAEIEPGRARVVYHRGVEIALYNVDGVFYAVDNLCPHEGGPLVAGTVRGKVLSCPWHRWQFHLDTGCSPVNPAIRVQTYPVRIEGDQIQIGIPTE